jgi:hypothetical protein
MQVLNHKKTRKMKNIILGLAAAVALAGCATKSAMVEKLEPGIKLKYQNQSKGTYANTVVYNPKLKMYYAAYAGNATYPLETFDETGKQLYTTETGADLRGMWWNPETQKLEANCYQDGGLVTIQLKSNGYAGGNPSPILTGRHQPDDQTSGAFDYDANEILYYMDGKLYKYSRETGDMRESIRLKNIPVDLDNIDYNALIFTGRARMEAGILNYVDKEVYFFDKATGELTKTLKLPSDAPTSDRMRFGFANNYLWLYDHDVRTWTGYKLFN